MYIKNYGENDICSIIYKANLLYKTDYGTLVSAPPLNLSSAQQKAVTLYKSCMDVSQIRDLGASPLIRFMSQLGGWMDKNVTYPKNNLANLLDHLYPTFNTLFYIGVSMDDKNTSRYIILASL